jgi:hypothetical protein
MEQGGASVRPEHRYLFNNTLEDRLTGVILEKQNWLEFVDMAQLKANAHPCCYQESKGSFGAWARSRLVQDLSLPLSSTAKNHKPFKGRQTSK